MSTSDYTILIIEDGEDLRNTLSDLLSISGYQVLTATNGKEGYNAITEQMPDLVLCDVNMPVMDGYELLKTLNKDFKEKPTPIFLFLTARVQFDDIKVGLDLGADDYITKPFDNIELLQSIEKYLSKAS